MSWNQPQGGYNANAPQWNPNQQQQQMGYDGQPWQQPQQQGGQQPYYGHHQQQQMNYGYGQQQQYGHHQQQQQPWMQHQQHGGYQQPWMQQQQQQQQGGYPPQQQQQQQQQQQPEEPEPKKNDLDKLKLSGKTANPVVMPKKEGRKAGKLVLGEEPKKKDVGGEEKSVSSPTTPTDGSKKDGSKTKDEQAAAAATAAEQKKAAPAKKKSDKVYTRDPRPHFNAVFCGHVDAGKSTISGHLLVDCGVVDEREMDKLRREAQNLHREGWEYAYVFDTSEEERAKGKTHETGSAYFETDERRITLLDAPGHKAFVPSMIGGAAQADLAVLVVSARTDEFEAGFDRGGQTREHAMLLRTCGVKHMLCLINKMDDQGWDRARYDDILSKIRPFLKQNGYDEKTLKNLQFLPGSGLTGDGVSKRVTDTRCTEWYDGPCLLELFNEFKPAQAKTEDDPLCIPLAGSYKEDGKFCVYGKVESGHVVPGNELTVLPTKKKVIVEQIQVESSEIEKAYPGDNVHLRLKGADETDFHVGFVLNDTPATMKAVEYFQARIVILDVKNILSAGSKVMLHIHSASEEISIDKILGKLDKKTLEPISKDPSHAVAGDCILARIECSQALTVETHSNSDKLGRFMLRDEGKTIAIGLVTKLYETTKAQKEAKEKQQ